MGGLWDWSLLILWRFLILTTHQLLQFSWVHYYYYYYLGFDTSSASSVGCALFEFILLCTSCLMFWSVLLSKWCPKSETECSNNNNGRVLRYWLMMMLLSCNLNYNDLLWVALWVGGEVLWTMFKELANPGNYLDKLFLSLRGLWLLWSTTTTLATYLQ
jgi:cytochrome c oxidase assembly factor CtaG